jgi:iduronate 2-sulfatase
MKTIAKPMLLVVALSVGLLSPVLAVNRPVEETDARLVNQPLTKGAKYTIYLCAGQSNMDGRAPASGLTGDFQEYAQPLPDVLIWYTTGGIRRPLRKSQGFEILRTGCSHLRTQFGPEIGFAHAMARSNSEERIILVKVADGGTNLHTDWNPADTNGLYAILLSQVKAVQDQVAKAGASCRIAGMIWMQGEADSVAGHAQKYQERLTDFIVKIRTDLGIGKMPFIIGSVCEHNPAYKTVRLAQIATANSVPAVGFAATTGLKTGDAATHYDARAQIELGKRFAEQMQKLSDGGSSRVKGDKGVGSTSRCSSSGS